MKIIITICFPLVILISSASGQINTSEQVFWSIIMKLDTKEILGYTKSVNSGMFNYHLSNLIQDTSLMFHGYGRYSSDSIKLTNKEKYFLIEQCHLNVKEEWNLTKPNDLIIVEPFNDSILSYLKKDRNRVLYSISQPVFIRDNSLCLVFVGRLCCGEINGNVWLSFYKKQDDTWIRWAEISGGAF